jgi:hypothetical protein
VVLLFIYFDLVCYFAASQSPIPCEISDSRLDFTSLTISPIVCSILFYSPRTCVITPVRLSEFLFFSPRSSPFRAPVLGSLFLQSSVHFAALQRIRTRLRVIIFVKISSYRAFYDLSVVFAQLQSFAVGNFVLQYDPDAIPCIFAMYPLLSWLSKATFSASMKHNGLPL